MTLKQNIQAVSDQIKLERATGNGSSATGDAVQREAQAAILAGQGNPPAGQINPEWQTYMERFARRTPIDPVNAAELARLLPTDGTHTSTGTNAERQKERAYLLANGTCGANTTDNLLNGGVTDNLDPVP